MLSFWLDPSAGLLYTLTLLLGVGVFVLAVVQIRRRLVERWTYGQTLVFLRKGYRITEQDTPDDRTARRLARYRRRALWLLWAGVGVGLCLGALADAGMSQFLDRVTGANVDPLVAQISPMMLALGMVFGVSGAAVIGQSFMREAGDTPDTTPAPARRLRDYRPHRFFLVSYIAVIESYVFALLLTSGAIPARPLFLQRGGTFADVAAPTWRFFIFPILMTVMIGGWELAVYLMVKRLPTPTGIDANLSNQIWEEAFALVASEVIGFASAITIGFTWMGQLLFATSYGWVSVVLLVIAMLTNFGVLGAFFIDTAKRRRSATIMASA